MEKSLQNEMKQLNEQFRDSLLIDRYDPQIDYWQKRRSECNHRETSEDTLVWNVFRTFNQIDRKLWVEQLFHKAFKQEFTYSAETIEIKLWKKIRPPKSLHIGEGRTDIDIIIESSDFVWFIEAKYNTDIRLDTDGSKRNELLRLIDNGTNYARKRDCYFSLLILDKYNSPMGFRLINEYDDSFEKVKNLLPHRMELPLYNGLSVMYWKDIQGLFKTIYLYSKNKYERYLADQASYWLYEKIRDQI